MEQSNTPAARPGFLTVLCILSYIGSGLWALFSLIGIFAAGMIMSWLGMAASTAQTVAHDVTSDTSNMMSDSMRDAVNHNVDKAADAVGGAMAMGTGIFIGAFVVSLLLAVLSIMGVMKMWQLKKTGFFMYAIANGLWLIFGIWMATKGGGWAGPVVTAAFLGAYAANMKSMN